MVKITAQDCKALYEKFTKYTETAEQHEFPKLLMINVMLDHTKSLDWDLPQKELRAMFRVVLKVIGEDCSIYKEDVNGE